MLGDQASYLDPVLAVLARDQCFERNPSLREERAGSDKDVEAFLRHEPADPQDARATRVTGGHRLPAFRLLRDEPGKVRVQAMIVAVDLCATPQLLEID